MTLIPAPHRLRALLRAPAFLDAGEVPFRNRATAVGLAYLALVLMALATWLLIPDFQHMGGPDAPLPHPLPHASGETAFSPDMDGPGPGLGPASGAAAAAWVALGSLPMALAFLASGRSWVATLALALLFGGPLLSLAWFQPPLDDLLGILFALLPPLGLRLILPAMARRLWRHRVPRDLGAFP